MLNAGLLVDLPHIEETGAAGIGLFRTELQFMVAATFPRTGEQLALYRAVLDAAGKSPVTFRTLDIGGDKVLPYMRNYRGREPGAGLARDQARSGPAGPAAQPGARAAARRRRTRAEADVSDDRRRSRNSTRPSALVESELTHLRRHGHELPERVEIGAMLEVPSLLFQLDELLERVDFLSVGSNDLMQFLYAADRGNPRVSRAVRSAFGAGAARAARTSRDKREEARQAGDTVRRACLASRSARWRWSLSAIARCRSRRRRWAR